ncbi:MAG: potassium-transporting ATPase subunit KdpC [Methylococcaceae bacterium]|jgi:K+-transporting ATPase ATPase C chain
MLNHLRPAASLLVLLSVLTGIIYPFSVTGLAQLCCSRLANGSIIYNSQGQAIASGLIGQAFSAPDYFWGRPSATLPYPYNGAASSGSNLGPTNPELLKAVAQRIKNLKAADPDNQRPIPVDLVTASASGLDPHISLAAANYQLARIAKVRHIKVEQLQELVNATLENRQWWVLGEPRVNVIKLNLALETFRP